MDSYLEAFNRSFKPEPFHALARRTQWCRRRGKIDPYEFLLSCMLGQASALRQTLDSVSQNLSDPVSRQAIDQRFNQRAVDYFHAAFDHVLGEVLAQPPTTSLAGLLGEQFRAVYLLDSTCFDLPPTLQTLFPACGGDGSSANAKVLLRYEYIQGQFEPLALLPGKRSDQGVAATLAALLQKDQLQLQDKGFYDAAAWHAVQQAGAFLLMPWTRSVTVWTRSDSDQPEQPLDIAKHLSASSADRVEWAQAALGLAERRVEGLRLTAFRLPPQSAARYRAALRESQRRQGRTPTQAALELAGWLILITNAPVAKLPTAMIAYLYRLRWQIELIFRQCKQTLRLDHTAGEDPYRTQCEIWARLLLAVFVFWWHAHATGACWLKHRVEISFEKAAHLIQKEGLGLARALIQGGVAQTAALRRLWRSLLKTARKGRQKTRTNSWDLLLDRWLDPQTTPAPVQAVIPAKT
jgi:hypothetical protein